MKTLKCQIFSDVICPWCLIGWTNLKAAQDSLKDEIELDVSWLPYELNPDMPAEGLDRQEYLETKFGGPDEANAMYSQVAEAAENAGVSMEFDRIERTPSTLKAHRLILLAETQNMGTRVKEQLFQRYFQDGQDIGQDDVLVDVAESCGLDGNQVRSFLASEHGVEPVRASEEQARKIGVQGVPFFIVDGKYALTGAQPPEVFVQALSEIAAEAA